MSKRLSNNYKAVVERDSKRLPVLYKSILVGLSVGIVTSLYRLTLMRAEDFSFALYEMLRAHLAFVPLAFIALGISGYFVGWLTSHFPMIRGSGIPQVKGIIMGYFKDRWLGTLIAKFIGGTLAIAAGLSLGREGPSIQLGACIAQGIGDRLGDSRTEKKILMASGASAGLAAAFNAPLAGAVFALEEIFKYFSPIILLSTMAAAVVADFVSKMIFGVSPVFHFNITGNIPLSAYWLLFLMGAVLGAGGALYNAVLISTQRLFQKIPWLNERTRLILPFLLAGILGLIFPVVLCGGHAVIGQLQPGTGIPLLLLILAVKFTFSMISFGSGAPGGIFFPLLILGATIGAIFGSLATQSFGVDPSLFYNFIILAMAGYFTAIVRAPITGIILLVEMTGSFTHMLSLTIVSVVAYVVADLLKSEPIYESMLEHMIAKSGIESFEADTVKKVTLEMIVHHGAPAENKQIKDLDLPACCLLIAIQRGKHEIIPHGYTHILAGDYLLFLTNLCDETRARETLGKLTSAK